jgi:N-acetylmuramoyl-L-alanine amidase
MLISSTLVFITFAVSTPAWSMRNAAPTSSVTNQPSTPVIIDPGHGGQDLGAVVKGLQEKSIALAVSWKLRDRIKDRIPVVMTREDDTYVTLDDRLVKAVDLNGAVFISIHLNHVRNKKLHGATVFSYGPEKHVARGGVKALLCPFLDTHKKNIFLERKI